MSDVEMISAGPYSMAVCKCVYGTAPDTVRGASATWASIKKPS